MSHLRQQTYGKSFLALAGPALLMATAALGMVTPNTKTFTAGEKAKVEGVIVSREGDTIKLRANDDSVDTIDVTPDTKIQLKKSFGRKSGMDLTALVPGLRIEAQGKGNDKGDLVAEKVLFDPNSMRASRQIDTRVSPLEARTGTLEGRTGTLETRTGTLENRTGQVEGRQTELEGTEKQTQQQVGQVKNEADEANQGVSTVNQRVSDLDNYQVKDQATVYFRLNSSVLNDQAKKDLDDLATKAKAEKGYVIEVAGFADKTGKAALNQTLSEQRADAVIRYLEQQGDIPIHRILTPAGMGTTHEAADNSTAQGRKLNRRVEVKVLVNQGVVAGSNQTNTAPAPKPPGEDNR